MGASLLWAGSENVCQLRVDLCADPLELIRYTVFPAVSGDPSAGGRKYPSMGFNIHRLVTDADCKEGGSTNNAVERPIRGDTLARTADNGRESDAIHDLTVTPHDSLEQLTFGDFQGA